MNDAIGLAAFGYLVGVQAAWGVAFGEALARRHSVLDALGESFFVALCWPVFYLLKWVVLVVSLYGHFRKWRKGA